MTATQRFILAFLGTLTAGAVIGVVMAFWLWFWEDAAFLGTVTTLSAIVIGLMAAIMIMPDDRA
jgi:predicted lipid-binding transport protein (Tim44 family)